jgi:hypothetical protein
MDKMLMNAGQIIRVIKRSDDKTRKHLPKHQPKLVAQSKRVRDAKG